MPWAQPFRWRASLACRCFELGARQRQCCPVTREIGAQHQRQRCPVTRKLAARQRRATPVLARTVKLVCEPRRHRAQGVRGRAAGWTTPRAFTFAVMHRCRARCRATSPSTRRLRRQSSVGRLPGRGARSTVGNQRIMAPLSTWARRSTLRSCVLRPPLPRPPPRITRRDRCGCASFRRRSPDGARAGSAGGSPRYRRPQRPILHPAMRRPLRRPFPRLWHRPRARPHRPRAHRPSSPRTRAPSSPRMARPR